MDQVPPDLECCQALKPNGHTFMTLGGTPGLVRCSNTPEFIAVESQPGKDGIVGCMSLCRECSEVLKRQMPGHATLARITP